MVIKVLVTLFMTPPIPPKWGMLAHQWGKTIRDAGIIGTLRGGLGGGG